LENFSENKPVVDFFNVKDYKITQNGVEVYSTADRAQRFKDRDILYGIDVLIVKQEGTDRLISDNGTLKDNILYLNGNVKYARADQFNLTTESVEYHELNKMLIGKTPFKFESKSGKAFGDSFVYNVKNGQIEAKNFEALMQMRNK
jgi:lipopolysaccharide assembly outer membrane protein LptD (OstA)